MQASEKREGREGWLDEGGRAEGAVLLKKGRVEKNGTLPVSKRQGGGRKADPKKKESKEWGEKPTRVSSGTA